METIKFSFYFWVYSEDELLSINLVKSIRQVYPNIEVIAISDGCINLEIIRIYQKYKVKFIYQNQEKLLNNGETFLYKKYTELLKNSNADFFIKVDPDSYVHKPLKFINKEWFGKVFKVDNLIGVWGCAMGISRRLIKLMLSNLSTTTNFNYLTNKNIIKLSEDMTLAYHLNSLNILPTQWLTIKVLRLYDPSFTSNQWSITHPIIYK